MSIEIEGLDNVLDALSDIADEQELKKAMGKACLIVERAAKQKAGAIRDTGELSRSIESRVEENGKNIVGVVFTPLEYAPYVEFGTGMYAENGDGRQGLYAR